MSNADNPHMGAEFEYQVLEWFNRSAHYKHTFKPHVEIKINNSKSEFDEAKEHEFDIVSLDQKIAIECKRYTWTKSWNVPCAKMGVTNEAAFYLTCLPDYYQKYIVMYKSKSDKKNITLAQYYYDTYKHLLHGIRVLEYDPATKSMICVNTGEVL